MMKKTAIVLSLLISVIFTQVQAETNYIECSRNKTNFKQFCNIKEDVNVVSIEISKIFTVGESNFDISNTLVSGSITFDGTENETLVLTSLRPHLQLKTDWNDAVACVVSRIWRDEIYIALTDEVSLRQMEPSRIYPGIESQTINLTLLATDTFKPWVQIEDDETVRLESNVSVFNRSLRGNRRSAFQRIPLDCNFIISDVSLYFDADSIIHDLAILKDRAEIIVQNISQSLEPESEIILSKKENLKKIMVGALAVTAIAKAQNSGYQNPEWMSLDSITRIL
jgi:hypothetical protein